MACSLVMPLSCTTKNGPQKRPSFSRWLGSAASTNSAAASACTSRPSSCRPSAASSSAGLRARGGLHQTGRTTVSFQQQPDNRQAAVLQAASPTHPPAILTAALPALA